MATNTYDDIPYATRPIYACHPDCLAVMGVLLGMNPAPLTRCRMLEIGCASAGNLIPIALQFPGSQFVGVDLSPVQIGAGQDVARSLGLTNIDLRAQSVMDVTEEWGQFDFIVCHGVFSWVPEPVREKILEICRTNLAPQGIAYISYNTFPGWYSRKTLRDLLIMHVGRFPEPTARVAQARRMLEFLDTTGLPTDSPAAQSLRFLIAELREQPDYYLFHEYLETENQPFYFTEFMARARGYGLQYMGNAYHHLDLDVIKPEARETLLEISEDLVQLEQFVDFLSNRPFRRSLLCHAAVSLDRTPPPGVVSRLHVGGMARPVSSTPDCYSNAVEAFVVDGKKRGSTDQPLTKTLFTFLAEIYPATVPFDALWAAIRERLSSHGCLTPEIAEGGSVVLAQTLVQAFLGNFASLHVEPFPLTSTLSARPRSSRLARKQVEREVQEVSNLRHTSVDLTPIDRILLPLVDGTRSFDQLVEAIVQRVAEGRLSFSDDAGRPLAGETLGIAVMQTVQNALKRLAEKGLLEA